MRKVLVYFSIFLMLFFVLPVMFANTAPNENVKETVATVEPTGNQEVQQTQQQDYEYQKFKTIKLLHPSTGQVEELNIDKYLYGVVSSEMPASFELEALKAQAVVARTYTIYQTSHNEGKHENADMCDDFNCCQAWISKYERLAKWAPEEAESNWNKIVQAVDSTKGKVVTYNGQAINAFFHANSGGVTESSLNIWGGIDYPYLKSVETSGEEGYTQYASEVVLSHPELMNKLQGAYPDCSIDFSQENCIQILENTTSGRVKTIRFGNKEIAGTEARTLLGLKSTNFTITITNENVTFTVTGYGHGVGMSQTGADALAKTGATYDAIIKHYYTDVEIIEVNSL